jgi:hypothetical protein
MINRIPFAKTPANLVLERHPFIGRDSPELPLVQDEHRVRVRELNKDLYNGLQSDLVRFIRSNGAYYTRSIELLKNKFSDFYSQEFSNVVDEFSGGLKPGLIINSIFANASNDKYSMLYFNSFNQELRRKFPALTKILDSYNNLLYDNNVSRDYELNASELIQMQNPSSKNVFNNFFDRIFLVAQRGDSFKFKEEVLAYALLLYHLHSETQKEYFKPLLDSD